MSARVHSALLAAAALVACGDWTDPATRIAFDIEDGAKSLAAGDGAKYTVYHSVPSQEGECTGPYKVQVDRVGALIVWCYDEAGATVSSHSTTTHGRTVDTAGTWIVDKPAAETLVIRLERRGGRAVIAGVE
ncbi:MAG TPA: hypothetical protein VD701_07410 [Steroidobacteraceae bacterium]|nr:hypothetical protein [Steroidobacteraceae bacterium]